MKLIKVWVMIFILLSSNTMAKTNEFTNIKIDDLPVMEFIEITSKIMNKNILITNSIPGRVNFISNEKVKEDDIITILIYVLQEKGYTLINNDGILRVIRLSESAQYNAPIIEHNDKEYYQVVTKVFKVDYSNVDYIAAKVRHLISKYAKLVTDNNSNSIIITDFLSNVQTVEKVIGIISADTKKFIKVIKLKNIELAITVKNLQEISKNIFNEKVAQEKVSIIENKNNNSIMIIGNQKNVEFLEKYVNELDKEDSLIKKVVKVLKLKNVDAKNVITIIDGIIGKKTYVDKDAKPFASYDETTNTIILMGQASELLYLEVLIQKLDIEEAQVYVQAKIIEVSERKINDIGIKYGISGMQQGSDGILSVSTAFSESFRLPSIPIVSSSGGFLTNDALAMGTSINFLQQNGAVDIISKPSILCVNNKEAIIYVGKTVSIKTASDTTDGGTTTNSYVREDIGLTLKVKPRISDNNKVILEIETILEDVGQTATNEQPDTSKKEIVTTAIVNNGEAVIIGGLIKNSIEYTTDKVPLLGDIPLLGALFRNKREIEDKINLVVVVTPYIIPQSKDISYVRSQLVELTKLEEEYVKKLELQLLKTKLDRDKKDIQRINDISEVSDEINELEKINKEEKKSNKTLHRERVNEILGE